MIAHLALIFALVATPATVSASMLQEDLPSFLEAAKEYPVTKVVNLLKDMKAQLEKEAEEDEEIYEKLACWCETNDKEKTKAIADAEAHIQDLTATIEELAATSARLSTEIKNLEKEVAENQEALDQAKAMRAKELAEFNAEEKDVLLNIQALKNAIIVLSKHNPGASLLQISATQTQDVATMLAGIMARNAVMFDGVLTPSQKRIVNAFVQSPEDYFDAEPTFKQSYAPASGQIFGILKQMKETFESNLSTSQKEELASQKAYEELKKAKEEEIAAGQEAIDTKTEELATTDEKLAASKQDMEDTKAGLSEDEAFLLMLKEKCQGADQEYEERQKTRAAEIEAVSKALAFLTSDEARDLFSKTFNPALIQKKSTSNRQAQASKLLAAIAKRNDNPRLMQLAMAVKLDAFTKVKKAIDDMIAQLLKEKQDEIKLKDFCRESFYENEMNTERKTREKEDLKKLIGELEIQIGELEKAIETLKMEIAEMERQMKAAGEDREKANKDFQLTVADQRASIKLLNAALGVLKSFYEKKAKAAALMQASKKAGPPPPPGFKEYKKNAAAGGVMGMIQSIIDDAKALEAEATRAEEESQKAYEDFVTETQASIEEKSKDIVNKSEEKAKAEEDKTQAETDKENVMLELDALSNEAADLHKTCDFVMKNFDIRQSARDEEIEGLKKAKAILSGAKFSEFLQSI